jgi:uncharacterized protein YeaO (DUF488 family)
VQRPALPHALERLVPIFIVQLGAPRKPGEGLRLGTVRRPPRGVSKSDFARLDYYDVWFPNLSPSAPLVHEAQRAADDRSWAAFRRKFLREMSAPDRSRELDVLAALSHHTNLSLGCYCRNVEPLPQVRVAGSASEARRGRSLRVVCLTPLLPPPAAWARSPSSTTKSPCPESGSGSE